MYDLLELLLDGIVTDMFITEQLHLTLKPIADKTDSTVRFEQSVLAGTILTQRQTLNSTLFHSRLIGRTSVVQNVGVIADRLSWNGRIYAVSEVVFRGDRAGIILVCCQQDRELDCIVEAMAECRRMEADCSATSLACTGHC